ncbi:tRNA (adenosine(37)-N6)-threonylcarbamoyltransferase complex dimerization subunit type 1 TsaB [Leucobacter weissii]|uniref:tRNA (adenosine(37)-N6)-threonylcarbamoyltransferase complex dimerization subunit type 1 TsaB n=1 Tax=Leucobacter weissii TaxID=1983706 RepID=UPI003132AE7C
MTRPGIRPSGQRSSAPGPREREQAAAELGPHVLLAIDTAIGTGAALGAGGRIFEAWSDDPRGHAEAIGGLVARVFALAAASGIAECAAGPAEVTGVVVGIGPGPFTGLRVGVAAAQAFALARRASLLPLHGHEAVALEAWEGTADAGGSVLSEGPEDRLRVIQDARRRELFVTEYARPDAAGIPVRRDGPLLVPRAEHVPSSREVWPERIPASGLVRLAARRLAANRGFEPDRAVYLRPPDAAAPGRPKRATP